mmetsp:Transcript_20516/g.32090  ORF Transcript_20516/g.32090 Transcript_20516/m.32090 type:complete len:307 (-) Transcript_20516:75-995(-)
MLRLCVQLALIATVSSFSFQPLSLSACGNPTLRVSCPRACKPLASVRAQAPIRPTRQATSAIQMSVSQSEGVALEGAQQQKKINGILFDIDGTLFDSDPVHFEVFKELLAKEGINGGEPIDEHFFKTKICGRQNAVICKELFPEWDEDTSAQWSAAKEAKFREMAVGRLRAMDGLEEMMQWIDKTGLKKAAVTNAPRENAEFMLKVIDRLDWFDTLVIGDELERAKPDPLPYQTAMTRLGVQPSECLVVEDSPSGATAGVKAGCFTVGILTSQSEEVLKGVGCKMLIKDYKDKHLWKLLQNGESNN